MIKTSQNEQLTKIGNLISSRLNKYESIIVLIFLLGLILGITTGLKISILIVLALNALAMLYFFNAFSVSEEENAGEWEIFINKLVSISSSVAIIGILFRIMHWSGFYTFIILGCLTLVILVPIILIIKSRKPDLRIFDLRLVIRIIVIAALGLFMNFAPKDTLIKIGFDKMILVENKE